MSLLLVLIGCTYLTVASTSDHEAMMVLIETSFDPLSMAMKPVNFVAGAVGGLFSSKNSRRRSSDTEPPCESVNPLDTNDQDCSVTRWNEIVSYYPFHKTLQKKDKDVIMAIDQVGQLAADVLRVTDSHHEALFGNTGSEGLIREAAILRNASRQLQAAGIAAADGGYDQLLTVLTEPSIDDVKNLKLILATAFADLKGAAENVTKREQLSADLHNNLMNKRATVALNDAVDTIHKKVVNVSATVGIGGASLTVVQKAATANVTRVQSALSDVADLVATTGNALEDIGVKAGEAREKRIEESREIVSANGAQIASTEAKQYTQLRTQLESESATSMNRTRNLLKNASLAAIESGMETANATDLNVESVLRTGVSNAIGQSASGVSVTLNDARDSIGEESEKATNVAHDVSDAGAAQASEVQSAVVGVMQDSAAVRSASQADIRDANVEAASLLSSLSQDQQSTFDQIVTLLNSQQLNSSAQLSQSENAYSASIVDFLRSIGTAGSEGQQSLTDILALVQSGQLKTMADVQLQFDSVVADSKAKANSLMKQVGTAGSQITDAGSQVGTELNRTADAVVDSIVTGSGNTRQALSDASDSLSATSAKLGASGRDREKYNQQRFGQSRGVLDGMLHSAAALSGQGEDVDRATSAVADVEGQQVADQLFGLSTNDDSMEKSIIQEVIAKREQMRSQLNALHFGDDAKASWESAEKPIAERIDLIGRMASEMQSDTGESLGVVGSMRNQLGLVDERIDNLTRRVEGQTDSVRSTISTHWLTMQSGLNLTGLNLQSTAEQSSAEAAKAGNEFLSEYLNNHRRAIQDSLEQANQATAAGEQSSGSGLVIARQIADALESFVDEAESTQRSLVSQIPTEFGVTAVDRTMIDPEKAELESQVAETMSTIRSEMMRLPQALRDGFAEVQSEVQVRSTDLSNRILALRDNLNASIERPEDVIRELVVSTKLQHLQRGVLDADKRIREQIQTERENVNEARYHQVKLIRSMIKQLTQLGERDDQSAELHPLESTVMDLGAEAGRLVNDAVSETESDAALGLLSSVSRLSRPAANLTDEISSHASVVNKTEHIRAAVEASVERGIQSGAARLEALTRSAERGLETKLTATDDRVRSATEDLASQMDAFTSRQIDRIAAIDSEAATTIAGNWSNLADRLSADSDTLLHSPALDHLLSTFPYSGDVDEVKSEIDREKANQVEFENRWMETLALSDHSSDEFHQPVRDTAGQIADVLEASGGTAQTSLNTIHNLLVQTSVP